ncbi:hypothetical protein [Haliangium sp.]|uniref:hypothetical protein n=1 Tax=Haliangium sp. TaxID=2663208 RepID=UPI003D0C1BF5
MRVPASRIVRRRLGIAARRLDTMDPSQAIGDLIDRSFPLPAGDPRYGDNSLAPGDLAIQPSFSELDKDNLRLALEPLGPRVTPLARRNETSREVRRLVSACYGGDALRWYDRRSEDWRGSAIDGRAKFGAWFGASFGKGEPRQIKAYYEMNPAQINSLPHNLQHAARVAMRMLPQLEPLFVSIGCGPRGGAMRVYFYHRGPLRLLELEPLMHRLGIGHQLPSLLTCLGLITGGRFVLDGPVLSLRDTRRGIEMKLEILLGTFPDPPQQMHGLIQMFLAQRPRSQHALRSWLRAMTPDDYTSPGDMSVVGVRVRPELGARLNIYFRPAGYDQPPSAPTRGPVAHRALA